MLEAHQVEAIANAQELSKWQLVNQALTKEELFEVIDTITSNGTIEVQGRSGPYTAESLKNRAELVLSGDYINKMTRAYGLRQQCLLILYYNKGIQEAQKQFSNF
jgi:hypothetical protein